MHDKSKLEQNIGCFESSSLPEMFGVIHTYSSGADTPTAHSHTATQPHSHTHTTTTTTTTTTSASTHAV